MKKNYTLLAVLCLLFLFACSQAEESKEDVVEAALSSPSNIDQYAVEVDINTNVETEEIQHHSFLDIVAEVSGEPVAMHQILTSGENEDAERTVETYRVDDQSYTQEDSEWTVRTVEEDAPLFEPSYRDIVSILEEVSDFAEFDADGSTYTFEFNGFDQEVYEAFERPFNVQLSGFDMENDFSLDFTIKINKEEHYIESLEYHILAENETGKLDMVIQVQYDSINDIDEIVLPEEALENASE